MNSSPPSVPSGPSASSGRSAPSSTRLRVARVVLVVAAMAAVGSGLGSIGALPAVPVDARMAETWRALGLIFFGGVFVVLAARPHACRGLWEITLANKAGLSVVAGLYLARGAAVGAGPSAVADGALVVMLVVAYVLVAGWRATAR